MSYPILTPEELQRCVAQLPRVSLAHLPTPLDEAPRFAERLGTGRIFIKRDDCTGMLFGGNKTRQNEFVMADALKQEADVLIWGASTQSNNCRQTAAACAKLGLECQLHLSRASHNDDIQGNLLLDHLMGARIEIVDVPLGPDLFALLRERGETSRAAGRRPYVMDPTHVKPIAAVSYVLCLIEIVEQLARQHLEPAAIFICSAGPTGSGLALAHKVLGLKCRLRLISPIRWPWKLEDDFAETANRVASLLGLPHRLMPEEINATLDYVGPAYGSVTPSGRNAMDLLARTEGILLDPVYTSKAMACLIDEARQGNLSNDETIVFIHTGGQTAIFAFRDELLGTKTEHGA